MRLDFDSQFDKISYNGANRYIYLYVIFSLIRPTELCTFVGDEKIVLFAICT